MGAIKGEGKKMVNLRFLFDSGMPFAGPESKSSWGRSQSRYFQVVVGFGDRVARISSNPHP